MSADIERLPVNVLTGFLGSGKTTLLRQLLGSPVFADAAVLINEFGEVGLDHLLVDKIDDQIVLLQSGCICCTIRGDLAAAIADLHARRRQGVVPAFDRLAIETTGLADPTPILATIERDPTIRYSFRLDSVITTVDGLNGAANLSDFAEPAKQLAAADRLVITKTDLAEPLALDELQATLYRINPAATIWRSERGVIDPKRLIGGPSARSPAVATLAEWLENAEVHEQRHAHDDGARASHSGSHSHSHDIRSFTIRLDHAIEWNAFGLWLTMLLSRHGTDILRFKGIVKVAESDTPVVVQGVQNLVYPPMHLETWPDADHRTRLVFIVRRLPREAIERSLLQFQRLGHDVMR